MASKESYDYTWIAKFSNKGKIEQFDKNGKEVMFGEVEAKKDSLVEFSIVGTKDMETYTVNLKTMKLISPVAEYTVSGSNPRLIYKRRNSVRVDMSTGATLDPLVIHIVGIKTDIEEKHFEVFAGKDMRPKKVEISGYSDAVEQTREDITAMISQK